MTSGAPWFKFFCRDWLDATRRLEPELRGIYVDLLCVMYDRDGPVPDDEAWVSHQLHISKRLWRSARERLIAAGKIRAVPGGLINDRAAAEIEERATRREVNRENGSKNARAGREETKKPRDIKDGTRRTGGQSAPYTRAGQSESDSDSDFNFVDQNDLKPAAPPLGWRRDDLVWLQMAVPGIPVDGRQGLRESLWAIRNAHGDAALDQAFRQIRKPVEAGTVRNVLSYLAKAAGDCVGRDRERGRQCAPPKYGRPLA